MDLLRSLISLEAEDEKNGNISTHYMHSANQLIKPKYLPSNNKFPSSSNKKYSTSSMNLANKKIVCTIQKAEQHEDSLEFDESSILYNNDTPSFTSYNSFSLSISININCSELTQEYESDIVQISQIDDNIELNEFPTDEFKFMNNIGHGAFGVVHKAFHLKSCQIVAVKSCRSSNVNSTNSFKNEIQICKEFAECAYIINMIEYGINMDTNTICIALEYMNMVSLNKNRGIFKENTLNRIKHVAVCTLNALFCLHSKLYIHNDIKPDNILINDRWELKLSDFGCIKQMKNADTLETIPLGTEYYQSYEKRFTSPIQYNTKSDIYSFGITICDLINEYKTDEDIAIPFKIPKQIIQKYAKPNCDFVDFLHKCLERDYKKRWSASQLLNHSFLKRERLTESTGAENITDVFFSKDLDELECMVDTLIDYYSHMPYPKNKSISVITPMDNVWSDADRIQNIAKCAGYSAEFVHDFIFKSVNGLRNKFLKT